MWTSDGHHTPTSVEVPLPVDRPWEDTHWERPEPKQRSFFILDRFTESVRVVFSSNDFIVKGSEVSCGFGSNCGTLRYDGLPLLTPVQRTFILFHSETTRQAESKAMGRSSEIMDTGRV